MTIKEEIQNINKQTDQIKEIRLDLEDTDIYEQLKARQNTFNKLYEAIGELKDYKECKLIADKLEEITQPLWELSNRVDERVEQIEYDLINEGGEIIIN